MNIHTSSTAARAHFRPKPDGTQDPAGEAGWYLQRERENRGVPLDKAGQDTGIHPYHLEAIEMGDLSALPERAQALRMVAAYARYLGFDPQPLVRHYERLLPRQDEASGRAFSSAKVIAFPLIERLRSVTSGAGGVVASVLGVVLLFGVSAWLITPGNDPQGTMVVAQEDAAGERGEDQVAAAGDAKDEPGVRTVSSISRLAEEALKDDAPEAPQDAATGVNSIEELIARTIPGVAQDAAMDGGKKAAAQVRKASAPAAERGGADAAAVPRSSATGPKVAKVAAVPAESREIPGGFVLRAVKDTWVRIEDENGSVVFSGQMNAGDTYTVPKREGLMIITRDGSFLEWLMDGKVMGRLSAPGQVLVGQPLDPRKLARGKG